MELDVGISLSRVLARHGALLADAAAVLCGRIRPCALFS